MKSFVFEGTRKYVFSEEAAEGNVLADTLGVVWMASRKKQGAEALCEDAHKWRGAGLAFLTRLFVLISCLPKIPEVRKVYYYYICGSVC